VALHSFISNKRISIAAKNASKASPRIARENAKEAYRGGETARRHRSIVNHLSARRMGLASININVKKAASNNNCCILFLGAAARISARRKYQTNFLALRNQCVRNGMAQSIYHHRIS